MWQDRAFAGRSIVLTGPSFEDPIGRKGYEDANVVGSAAKLGNLGSTSKYSVQPSSGE